MYRLRRLIRWIRFGTIKEVIRAEINGTAAEIEYIGRNGKTVGYWAYGDFDPHYPYQG